MMLGLLAGCRSDMAQPVDVDPIHDWCAQCRMVASDPRLAAEIVAPGAEPLIFDDIGCLRDYLGATPVSTDAIVYVADHRTGQWVRAEDALFMRSATLSTPMGSAIIAHSDLASKNADPAAHGGEPVAGHAILPHAMAGEVAR